MLHSRRWVGLIAIEILFDWLIEFGVNLVLRWTISTYLHSTYIHLALHHDVNVAWTNSVLFSCEYLNVVWVAVEAPLPLLYVTFEQWKHIKMISKKTLGKLKDNFEMSLTALKATT